MEDTAIVWRRLEKCTQTIKAKHQSWTTQVNNASNNTGERAEKLRSEAEVTRQKLIKLSYHKEKLKLKLEGNQISLTDSEDESMAAGNPWDQGK